MKNYSFSGYAPSLSNKSTAVSILNDIKKMNPEKNQITIDFEGLIAMTTICARIIFGRLYYELGPDVFYNNIKMKNLDESLKIVIKWGILKELEQISNQNKGL